MMRRLVIPLILGCLVIAAVAGGRLPVRAGAAASGAASGSIVTTGQAEIAVVPDRATVVVGVSVLAETAAAAQADAAARTAAVRRAIQALGIADRAVQTRQFRVEPEYDYEQGKQVQRGYRAAHDLLVEVTDLTLLGLLLDEAVNAGATEVRDVQFCVTNEATLMQQALQAAVGDARQKAEALAAGAGVENIRIVRMRDNSALSVPMRADASALKALAAEEFTEIAPGEIKVRAEVEAEFAF